MFDAGSHEGDGLGADAYRQRFGLMQKVKLRGPAWLAMLRETKSEHIRNTYSPLREPVKTIATAERRAEQANSEWPVEHGRNTTPPEPMRAPLKAEYRTETGHPDEFIRQVGSLRSLRTGSEACTSDSGSACARIGQRHGLAALRPNQSRYARGT